MVNYKTIGYGALAALAGAALYKYGVQDLGGNGYGAMDQLIAPIGHTLNTILHGGDRIINAVPGAIEAGGLAGIIAGIKGGNSEE